MNKNCAYSHEDACTALDVLECPISCSFYKTSVQRRRDEKNADIKLRRLPFEQQLDIAIKYYGRKLPWLRRQHANR